MFYPLQMELRGRRCIVIGGGAVALRKVRALLEAEGEVVLIAPEILPDLARLAEDGEISWKNLPYEQGRGFLDGAALVFCATDRPEVNRAAAMEARALRIFCNVCDMSTPSDFSVPAHFRRGRLLFTVSTGNLSPAFSRALRIRMEEEFPSELGAWLERLAELRVELKSLLPTSGAREDFWRRAFSAYTMELLESGRFAQAEVELRDGIDRVRSESSDSAGGSSRALCDEQGGNPRGT